LHNHACIAFIVIALTPAPARAQEKPAEPAQAAAQVRPSSARTAEQLADDAKDAVVLTQRRESTIVYPSSLSGTTLSDAGIVAGDKDKRAFINYAIRPNDVMDLVFSASAPLADEGATGLIQLDGLASKTKVGVSAHFGVQRLPNADKNAEIFDALWPECLKLQKQSDAAEQADTGVGETGCNFEELDDAVINGILKPYRRTSWFFTLEANTGPETFKFADSSALDGDDVEQTKWSAAGAAKAGFLLPNNVSATLGVRIENGYEAQKNKAVCPAVPSPQPVACPIKPVGEPDNKRRNVVEAEVRRFLGSHAGISPIARWDWREGDKSIEIPVYLVRDKDGGLRGGVSYGHVWSDDKDKAGDSLTIFVSQTFSLAP
jgi:hypothetical protein